MVGPGGWVAAALMAAGVQALPPHAIGKPHPPVPIGNVGQWFGADAYPPDAIAANEQGRVAARVTVGTDGKPTACAVTSSSGSFALDSGTCAIVMGNITFAPAVAVDGGVIIGYYSLAVRWVMPAAAAPPAATGGAGTALPAPR